jgi:hypothetical protein
MRVGRESDLKVSAARGRYQFARLAQRWSYLLITDRVDVRVIQRVPKIQGVGKGGLYNEDHCQVSRII